MKNKVTEYKNEFLKRFQQNDIYSQEQAAFSRIFGNIKWHIFPSHDYNSIAETLKKISLDRLKNETGLNYRHKASVASLIQKSKRTRRLETQKFNGFYVCCLPLVRGSNIYGYLILSRFKNLPDDNLLYLLSIFTKSVAEEVNKGLELTKLYEVIRPRAIALSTIHTIHRIIGSTLDINELLPRIGRLALQVLRTEYIEIYMKDEHKKDLKCVVAIDYKKSKDFFKIQKKYKRLAKKVVNTARFVLKNDIIATPLVEEENIIGAIIIRERIDKKQFNIFDQEILTTLAEQAVVAIKNAQLYKEQEDITVGSIKSLASLLDVKLPGVYTHTNMFVEVIIQIGKDMNLPRLAMRNLHYSALLPDLGKFFVPENILKKTTALDKKEYAIIKKHTKKAVEIMEHLHGLKETIPIILHHHERFDGRGYPARLKGENIPVGARIMAVVDAFEAMMRRRRHKKRFGLQMAVREIKSQAGKQFDPKVVESFMHLYDNGKLAEIVKKCRHELRKNY